MTLMTSMIRIRSTPLASLALLGAMSLVAFYFIFAAVRGDYGLVRRAEVEAETLELRLELGHLSAEVAEMENLTRRLSDAYLDLDLLDEQARDVLGLIRPDEVVIE